MENIRQQKVKINKITKLGSETYLLDIESAYLARKSQPGNFIHIKIESVLLRRPFSIHKVKANTVFVLFKKKGRGTSELAKRKKSDELDVIGPLGKGFEINQDTKDLVQQNILIAGGIGVAPLVFLAKKLKELKTSGSESQITVLLGVRNKKEILCQKDFEDLGCIVHIATEDGSKGLKGTVTRLLEDILRDTRYEIRTAIYACGPEAMFVQLHKIIKKHPRINCQVSFEQFMGCGLGFCCGCVIKTKKGYKKVCKDGPVFNINDIW